MPSADLTDLYPIDELHDAFADREAHIPYSSEFFTALGSSLARKVYAIHRRPFKVIVLDCDDTLWQGDCGSVGPWGVEFTPEHRLLQEFMVAQSEQGILLCLCSKNLEADVLEVFNVRDDMPLKLTHLVDWQINWQPKSENLHILAQRLHLGLDSFIFLDNNPMECAEVKANCPQVLTLQLPSQPGKLAHFLRHVWAFDHLKLTEADRLRTFSYQQNLQREQLRQNALTLSQFLESLALQVKITPMQPHQLERVAQLTQRSNQFNATTICRSESEIQALCQTGEYTCLVVEVSDRFGDYGLVGIVLFQLGGEALEVDTFLMSCRVLGRGVEHRMLSQLGTIAKAHQWHSVVIPYRPTAKNLPIYKFLNEVGPDYRQVTSDGERFVFPAANCESIVYQPESITSQEEDVTPALEANPPEKVDRGIIEYIAHQLSTVEDIQEALTNHKQALRGSQQQITLHHKALVAYVVGEDNLDITALKAYLKQQLPDYMVPSVVMPLNALPLTPTGTVDHKALPDPNSELSRTHKFVVPQTERQRLIASCFAEVLSLSTDHIGLYNNFFELGGHSLLATQLMSRLRQIFEVEIPLRVLFESPTIADLDMVLSNGITPGLNVPAIVSIERGESPIALSYAQERLWFLTQLEGASATYNIPGAVHLEGMLDIDALQNALNELVCRHEILRTTFLSINGVAVQEISPNLSVRLQIIAASDLQMPLLGWLTQEAHRPFDLETGPLLRVSLVRLREEEAVLAVTIHHIISDGWSIEVFIQELTTLYRVYRAGQPSPLSPLPIQYADYAFWQRQWLQGDVLETQLSYWRNQLFETPALLELPTDYPRPAVQTFCGQTCYVTLPPTLSAQVKALAQRQGVTLFMVLLAAFQVLLYRYSGQSDIVVGSPIANRQQAELEPLIGFFVNTLVLRTQIGEKDTVADLLHQVKRIALEAYAHQEAPFEQVVEALNPERTLAHSPLFQVMFVLQNAPKAPLDLPEVTLTPLSPENNIAIFDLTLSVTETETGLVGSWEYNRDLFKADTISRMAAHFETLLTAMVADETQSVATLPLLTVVEQQQLLVEWNATAVNYPQEQCIHQLFEAQVERTPEAIAVVYNDEHLTYQELNAKANQLAHHLEGLGVGPEVLVGICVERSIEMV
ncbi:MAG: HAD-IIIC family phosphatase, partial [Acaryochloris sp. CRU_2_0]|nr:HAD-IIIC family phosphatase [Acaryochloris sp. CRU_2_0]